MKLKFNNKKTKKQGTVIQTLAVVTAFALIVATGGCSSGGSSSSSSSSSEAVARYSMPSEISAVPSSADAESNSVYRSTFMGTLRSLARAYADEGTDYANAVTAKYVEEHSLRQFQMLETVLGAMAQTMYAEEVGNGAYTAMIAFEEKEDGKNQKSLQKWVVQSDVDGTALRLQAWIEEKERGETELIKAEFRITEPPTQNPDGSYVDYGEWTLNVKFDETGEDDFFVASCEIGDDGVSIIKVHEKFNEMGGPGGGSEGGEEPAADADMTAESKAIMYRSETSGYGKVYYPDFEALFCFECEMGDSIPHKQAAYAYNDSYLSLADGDGNDVYSDPVTKDRANVIDMTHRYGVFNSETGADLMKSKSFGFPFRYTDSYNMEMHSYYGAWQGRHEIWGPDGGSLAEGTVVTRETFGSNETAETYTVGPTFNGVLVKRTTTTASLNDIQGIPVEIWINNDYNLVNDGGTWKYCTKMDWDAASAQEHTPARATGSNDMTTGHDWSTTNETFVITAGCYENVTITLNANCADDMAVASHINAQLVAAQQEFGYYMNVNSNTGNVEIEMWHNPAVGFEIVSGDALTTLGLTPTTYTGSNPMMCEADGLIDFDAQVGFESLIVAEGDFRKHVNINAWDQCNQENIMFMYKKAFTYNSTDYNAGLYQAEETQGEYGFQLELKIVNGAPVPVDTDQTPELWIWVGGSIWVEYTGDTSGGKTGWVEKAISYFNEQYWRPEFSDTDSNDNFKLPENRELYINMEGANYIALNDGSEVTVKQEIQSACNPDNVGTFVASGTVFKDSWNPDYNSTYSLFTSDPSSSKYLMLVYASIGDNDKDQDGVAQKTVGEVVTDDLWGLTAYVSDSATDDQFNWEYSADGGWGTVTYLVDSNDNYVILSDPVRFNTITTENNAGETKNLLLQYDGWMMGLPDLYMDLQNNNWVMTDELADKIVNLDAGTQVTDSADGTVYVLKPLEISQFLAVITDTSSLTLPDVAQGKAVDLSTVPDFVEHGMGDMPTGTIVKYSEGVAVE